MQRRDFIKNTAILSGGLMLNDAAYPFAAESPAQLKVGVIGCGDRGNGLISILKKLEGKFEVTACCDVLDFRLADAAKLAGTQVRTYKDYRKLLEQKDLDAIFIATPLNEHFDMAVAALDSGRHVFLEKTMTYDIPQALELVKKAAKHPRQILQVGHQYRYTPLYFKVREMIQKGYLGKVTQIDCRWDRNGNWRRPVSDPSLERAINWRMYRQYSGGLVAELLSHQIDFINWAFDTHPDIVLGTGGIDHYKDGRETYDNVQVVLRYDKDGMIGNFGATCANERDGYLFKIKGSKGSIHLLVNEGIFYPEKQTRKELQTVDGVAGATKITWTRDGGIPVTQEPMKDGTWYALNDFHKCIAESSQPASNVKTGARTAIVVHLANQALYGNTVTRWDPSYDF